MVHDFGWQQRAPQFLMHANAMLQSIATRVSPAALTNEVSKRAINLDALKHIAMLI